MMEKINLVELLKDCPKGMELDCTMYDNCTFNGIEDVGYINILVKTPSGIIRLTKEGCYIRHDDYAKCVIFPKGKTTWEGFQKPFINGDVITSKGGIIALFSHTQTHFECSDVVYYHCMFYPLKKFTLGLNYGIGCISDCRFATEEEKQKLFQAIKDNGYYWDEETNTLKQLTKFKVGDRIRAKDNGIYCTLENYSEGISAYRTDIGLSLTYKDLEQWEFAPNKFDISTLKPFDKVLVRDSQYATWVATLFSHIGDSEHYPYVTTYINTKYCIPYNIETKHLVGTTLEEPEFYKI